MKENLKFKTLSSLGWNFLQKLLGQSLSFLVTVILARMLQPQDYGVVALSSMFLVLLSTFMDGGLNAALIQKKSIDDKDYNTVFYFCLVMSFVIYFMIYMLAPLFSSLYANDLICPIVRVLALTIPLGALTSIQNAIVIRDLRFKTFFYASIIGQIVSAIIGITMAYLKYGPWALVAQNMASSIINTLVMLYIVRWFPKLIFSRKRFKQLFSFAGSKFAAGFIGTLCDQLKGYLIGFKYTAADLAFLNRGEGLPELFKNNISGTINTVLFPALSRLDGNAIEVKKGIRRSMMTSSYLLTPIFLGLAAVSDKLVPLIYSLKWSPAIPFMKIACLTSCIGVLNTANLQSLFAIGKSYEVLKLEFYKKPIMLLILGIAIFISPLAISFGMFIYSFVVLLLNSAPNSRLLNYSLREQIKDVSAGIILSIVMALLVFILGYYFSNVYISLCIQVLVGIFFYWGMSHILKIEAYVYLKNLFIQIILKK